MECISEDTVVLVRKDKLFRTFTLKKGRKASFDRLPFYPDGAFGHPYGSCFEVHGKQLVLREKEDTTVKQSSAFDNRDLHDDGSSQALTDKDISELKEQGATGKEIVESMIEHSSSFHEKTRFSQEKYIRKKQKKHVPVLSIMKPTTRAICHMYYNRGPSKICHIRLDKVAQILTLGNIHAYSNILVMETCQGLLLGAILERMGGYGHLVQVFYGDFPVRKALDSFGHLSDTEKSILMEYPLHKIGSLLDSSVSARSKLLQPVALGPEEPVAHKSGDSEMSVGVTSSGAAEENSGEQSVNEQELGERASECRSGTVQECSRTGGDMVEGVVSGDYGCQHAAKKPRLEEERKEDMEEMEEGEEEEEGEEDEKLQASECLRKSGASTKRKAWWQLSEDEAKAKEERRREKEARYKETADLLMKKQMDGLVIVTRFHPEPLMMALIEFVAPSRPIVVYCHLLEPLVQCYRSLKESRVAYDLQISETWLRYYQVLPERTHPEMSMDAQGGYLLHGTTISCPP